MSSVRGKVSHTSLEVELDVRIFLLLGAVVVGTALDTLYSSDSARTVIRSVLTLERCATRALLMGSDATQPHSALSACPD